MSDKSIKNLSLEEYVQILSGRGNVDGVKLDDLQKLKLYPDINQKNNLQQRISLEFPNPSVNDGDNIKSDNINNNGNQWPMARGKVKIENIDDLINIKTYIVSELLKQDRKNYPDPKVDSTSKKNKQIDKQTGKMQQITRATVDFLSNVFSSEQLVLPKDVDLNNPSHVKACHKLKISYDDKVAIMNGFMQGFDFNNLTIFEESGPNENFVKLCAILWRCIDIEKNHCADAYTYRSVVIEHLTCDSSNGNSYWQCLYKFMNKIAKMSNIALAFEKMKSINMDNMHLSETVKEDFQQFISMLRKCNVKIIVKDNYLKAVRDRSLSLKKLALVFGSAITGTLVFIFIFNLLHVFISVSFLLKILFLVIATALHILFEIINIKKKILHIPFIHTSECEKECDLGFDLDCYNYPSNEKSTIPMRKQKDQVI